MSVTITTIAVLGAVGIVAALALYFVSRRFHVEEDPLIGLIEAELPGANCGGCGFKGCHDFAVNCAKSRSLGSIMCPVGGEVTSKRIASIMGIATVAVKPMIAVVKCAGSCEVRPRKAVYDGAGSCALATTLGSGATDCSYGCLGQGDCERACPFEAIHINAATGLPEVDEDKCTACGACVKACPKSIIELRAKGPKGLRVWVACSNRERGPMAMKACKAACIACGKCFKVCEHDAITIADNLSYIDFNKCKLCRKCVVVCPTKAILTANFPKPIERDIPTNQTPSQQ